MAARRGISAAFDMAEWSRRTNGSQKSKTKISNRTIVVVLVIVALAVIVLRIVLLESVGLLEVEEVAEVMEH